LIGLLVYREKSLLIFKEMEFIYEFFVWVFKPIITQNTYSLHSSISIKEGGWQLSWFKSKNASNSFSYLKSIYLFNSHFHSHSLHFLFHSPIWLCYYFHITIFNYHTNFHCSKQLYKDYFFLFYISDAIYDIALLLHSYSKVLFLS